MRVVLLLGRPALTAVEAKLQQALVAKKAHEKALSRQQAELDRQGLVRDGLRWGLPSTKGCGTQTLCQRVQIALLVLDATFLLSPNAS